ncbi:putative ORFan [Tupanvirus deep ocean]|uniref:ORFan n=2 Tax=Tupanvirus TaxID=2094720 RepID=A0AC62A9X6_9VIRU|nr:putative ORFan [Tupanvirus deep ocean]QKU34482.1 putative ORFan [Tupanvirus deep ocean]
MECKFCSNNIGGYFYCDNCGAGACGSYGCGEWVCTGANFCETCCKIKCNRPGCTEICGLNRYCVMCDAMRVDMAHHVATYHFDTFGIPGGHVYEEAKNHFKNSQ